MLSKASTFAKATADQRKHLYVRFFPWSSVARESGGDTPFRMTTNNESSFTLVELLIVIAIIGILSAVVVVIINPSQLLLQARDSRRIEEIANINKAILLYITDDNHALGSTNTVYVSIPDTTSTCANLGLPTLPSGWSYHCVSTTTLRNIDGTGWIPINFNLISHGSRISILPIDPVNTASSQNYYTYATGGLSYELTAYFESDKYQTQAAESGNPDPTTYAVGNVSLTPFVHGLVGYWGFDEGGGTTANDSSGFLNTGTMYSSSTITNLRTATNCLSESCVYFDGTDDYINNGATPQLNGSVMFTIVAWVKPNTTSVLQGIVQRGSSNSVHGYIFLISLTPERCS